jgi:hypothetical protein
MREQGNQNIELHPDQKEQAELVKTYLLTVQHFFGGFQHLFSRVLDPREQSKIKYPLAAMCFVGVQMFLFRLGARRQIKEKLRNNGRSIEKYEDLFSIENAPHGDSINYLFKKLSVEQVQMVVSGMTQTLIRKKLIYPYRLFGYYMIAIDGTGMLTFPTRHCPHCLEYNHSSGTIYYHHVLEAKLVTENGFAFSLMTEFIENQEPDWTKQDCELKAFYRLTERLKTCCPHLPVCLLGDGLFANGPTFSLCQRYHWKYIIILKDADLPSVNQEFTALMPLLPDNHLTLRSGDYHEIEQIFSWATHISYQDTFRCEHNLSVLQCIETKPDSRRGVITSKFKWVTNFDLTLNSVPILANKGGRLRWKIENEGFNCQKNGGFELEHAYSTHVNAYKIFYFLMQIAHIIFQLLEKGSLLKTLFSNGIGSAKNLSFRLLEAWRNAPIPSPEFFRTFPARLQIRFDSS